MRRSIRAYPPEYWDELAARWDSVVDHPRNPHQFYYREADLLISRVLSKRMRVLELGCGTGGSTQVHAKEVSGLVATDFAQAMVRRARRKLVFAHRADPIDFAVCDAQRLPFRSTTFDTVFCRGVMMSYVEDPRRAVSEMHRILRPKGLVAFDVMNRLIGGSAKLSGGRFDLQGRTPTYVEMRIRGDRQVRRVFSLPRTRQFLDWARADKLCRKRPKGVIRLATSVERYEARTFRPTEVDGLLVRLGFEDVRLTPLGHLAHLLATDDKQLRQFLRAHRARLPRLSIGLAVHLKTETALHLFVTATKR